MRFHQYFITIVVKADSFNLQESDPMRIDLQMLSQQETEFEKTASMHWKVFWNVYCIVENKKWHYVSIKTIVLQTNTNRENFITLLEFQAKTYEHLRSFMDKCLVMLSILKGHSE